MRDLLAELTSLLKLPTLGPDGRAMGYRIDSKALGRELREDETLAQAGVPANDRLILTADITAGANPVEQSPRQRRLRGDHERMVELAARSDADSLRGPAGASRLGARALRPDVSLQRHRQRRSAGPARSSPSIIRLRSTCTANTRNAGPG